MDLLADLEARGLIHDCTDRTDLATRLGGGPIGVYIGFDPTADSLHVGHLVGQLFMRRFQLAGHRPYPLAGGATGMVGDPSGRSDERNLLDLETLRHNVERIKLQLTRLFDFDPGPFQATLVNNADWTEPMTVLDFLRDVGKYATVNQMLARDSVRNRLDSESGISFTEFSYMLLQANDFRHLYEHHGVELQAGASDQWGNIVAGVDLVRRRLGGRAFGLTHPLITKADGTKYGKSASGSVWLDPERTSPYQFRQFWMQADDVMIGIYLKMLSMRSLTDLEALDTERAMAPERRLGQRALADEMTELVHGSDAAAAARQAAEVLFGGDPNEASEQAFAVVAGEVPTHTVTLDGLGDLVKLLVDCGLASSNGDARRTLGAHGYRVNGLQIDEQCHLAGVSRLHERYLLLRKGRSTYCLVEISSQPG